MRRPVRTAAPSLRPAPSAALVAFGLLAASSLGACSQDEGDAKKDAGGPDATFTEQKPTKTSGKIDKTTVSKDKASYQRSARQGNPAYQDQASLSQSATSSGPTTLSLLLDDADTDGADTPAPSNFGDCAKTTGEAKDADGDKWPKGTKTVLDCDLSKIFSSLGKAGTMKLDGPLGDGTFAQAAAGADFQWKITGGFSASDANDAKKFPKAGFTFSYDDFRTTMSGTGKGGKSASMEMAMGGGMTVTGDENGLKGSFKLKTVIQSEGKTVKALQWIDSESKPDSAGDIEASGTASFSGWMSIDQGDGKVTNIKVSTKDLAYDKTCAKTQGGWKSGTIVYEAGEGKAEYTFDNCQATLKVNGEEIK